MLSSIRLAVNSAVSFLQFHLDPVSDHFAQAWTSLTGEVSHLRTHERLFDLTHVIAPRLGPGSLRRTTPDETTLVVRWIKAFQEEALRAAITDEEAA